MEAKSARRVPVHAVTEPKVGDMIAEKYRIERVLGYGGMGVVFAARHEVLDQIVAIKFLQGRAAEDPSVVERFRREARIAAKVRSDYVPHVFDVGTMQSGGRFLVMEYLEGVDVGDELEQRGRIPVEEACLWILQALDAIGRAHAAGIIHRDIKPTNLYLAQQRDGTRRIKVLDFGISKQVGRGDLLKLTSASDLMGSPLYMPPEQVVAPEEVDARADLWSIGAVLYEMLSGSLPYPAENLPQICAKLLHEQPIPLSKVAPDLPSGLCEVAMTCLRRDLSERIGSAEALAEALYPYVPDDEGRPSVFHSQAFSGAFSYTRSSRGLASSQVDVRRSSMTPLGWSNLQHTTGGISSSQSGAASSRPLTSAASEHSRIKVSPGERTRWIGGAALLFTALSLGVVLGSRGPTLASVQEAQPPVTSATEVSFSRLPHTTFEVPRAEKDQADDGRPDEGGVNTDQPRNLVRRATPPAPRAARRVPASSTTQQSASATATSGQAPSREIGEFHEFGGRK